MKPVKGPAQTPSVTSKAEEFLKSLVPFPAFFDHDPTPIEVVHIDKYLFVTKASDGMVTFYYKAQMSSMSLPLPVSSKLAEFLAK